VIVDSHFAERGRLGRLLGAVAQHPYNVGIGMKTRRWLFMKSAWHASSAAAPST
jgi:cyanophycinase-like exopeptidase